MLSTILGVVSANWLNVAVALLVLDRALERIFPNAALLSRLDAILTKLGIQG